MLGAAFGALLWQMTAAMHAADTIDNSPPSHVTGKIAGYRGIWFDLGQKSEYGSDRKSVV